MRFGVFLAGRGDSGAVLNEKSEEYAGVSFPLFTGERSSNVGWCSG